MTAGWQWIGGNETRRSFSACCSDTNQFWGKFAEIGDEDTVFGFLSNYGKAVKSECGSLFRVRSTPHVSGAPFPGQICLAAGCAFGPAKGLISFWSALTGETVLLLAYKVRKVPGRMWGELETIKRAGFGYAIPRQTREGFEGPRV